IQYDPKSGQDVLRLLISGAEELYDLRRVKLLGVHNRYNIAAAVVAARMEGVDQESIQRTLEEFSALEHRMEIVHEDDARVIVNDSKATTVSATRAALAAVRERYPSCKLLLMVG